jgi:WD40 repeat protein
MLVLTVGRKARLESLAFAPDGRGLVATGDTGAYLWTDFAASPRGVPLPETLNSGRARFSYDGRWLFVTFSDRLIRFDPATRIGHESRLWGGYYTWAEPSPVAPLALVSQHVFASGDNRVAKCHVGLWRVDDLGPNALVWEREFPLTFTHGPQFLPGGDRFARVEGRWTAESGRHESRVTTFDTATGDPVARSEPVFEGGYDSFLSPDGRLVAMRGTNVIEVWSLTGPAGWARARNDSRKYFTAAAFHPSGKYLGVASNDKTVKLFDTTTWEVARVFTWDIGRTRSIAFSPDGTLAAAGSDSGKVVVWDVDG